LNFFFRKGHFHGAPLVAGFLATLALGTVAVYVECSGSGTAYTA